MLTEKVRAEFIGRGKYQTLPESTGVDALLTGEVANVAIVPSRPLATGRYRVRLELTVAGAPMVDDWEFEAER